MSTAEKLIAKGEARGEAKGEARGQAQGEARGVWIGKVQWLEEFLGETPTSTEDFAALSLEDLEARFQRLQKRFQETVKKDS